MLRTQKNGFVILIVLIAVAIMMLLYFVQIEALFGPGMPNEPAGLEEHPWILEELLISDGEDIKLPRKPKLELNEPFSMTAPVNRNDARRGEISVAFDMKGRVFAKWQCTYEQDGIAYGVDAQARGNIHVKRTYQDKSGKDKSRLFFIAKGRYQKMPVNAEVASGNENGTVWLTGWIDPDRRVQGHITLTTNQQWAAVYRFENSE